MEDNPRLHYGYSAVPAAGFLRFQYLSWFAKPVATRSIFWSMRKTKPRTIVQLGIGTGELSVNLLDVALRFQPEVRFTGVDLFEGRADSQSGLALKTAHQLLAARGAKVKLVPGEPFPVLSRVANTLVGTDMLLISADQDQQSLEQAWFFVPRMLHAQSKILWEETSGNYRTLSPIDIDQLAQVGRKSRRNAA